MAVIRVGISAALGVLVTFALIILMYKLIDSGSKELDEKESIKIPDFLHVDRQLTENANKTEVEKPEDPETPPPLSLIHISEPTRLRRLCCGRGNYYDYWRCA